MPYARQRAHHGHGVEDRGQGGEQVAEGQVCVILESMKMEMPVEAPSAGKVEKVHVAEGQAVNEGDVLVTLA